MKNKRKVLECSVLSIALAITAAAAAVSGNASDAVQSSRQEVDETVYLSQKSFDETGAASASADAQEESAADSQVSAELLTAKNEIAEVSQNYTAVLEGADAAEMELLSDLKEQAEETAQEEEESEETGDPEWAGRLMADVENSLNVRAEASKDSEIVGKLYAGAAADVIEVGEEWTKISSGNVEGYVKNEYCVYGDDAKELAQSVCTTYAESLTGGLRVRGEASTDSKILTVLEKGEKTEVDTDTEAPEGWVAVFCGDETAFVSAEYVELETETGTAVTLEEEQEMLAEEEAASSASSGSSSSADDGGISSSADDVTLLAALICCEAGGECYEGKVAVGAVVVNRVQSSAYPNSVSDVIYQSGQFGPAGSGALAAAIADGSYSSCVSAAQEALSGTDNTGGATSFHAGSGSGTVIGNQTFY